jgi:glycogen(starch) synthase
MSRPTRRLVIAVRADPVICGHSGEARNLAEVALTRGFDDVRLLTWPIPALQSAGLPLKPLDRLLPYSPGITVERPEAVGDYRVPDGRHLAGLTGRLVELLSEPVPTVCLSMYLVPHTQVINDAVTAARAAGFAPDVRTIAKAVGSDVTNVIRSCLREGRFGAATVLLTTFLASDEVVAVSEYTRDEIIASAEEVDAHCGTTFAAQCRERVTVSYPPIDSSAFVDLDPAAVDAALERRGLKRDEYVLFLSRVARAKGIYDLVIAYGQMRCRDDVKLVVAGTGPALEHVRAMAKEDDRILFLTDVDDDEKPLLMAGCAAYALPTKPEPDFVETFGIALAEKGLAGGGPIITTTTGGVLEAVGDAAVIVEAGDIAGLAEAVDRAVLDMSAEERRDLEIRAREHAMTFDRGAVFDQLFTAKTYYSVRVAPAPPAHPRPAVHCDDDLRYGLLRCGGVVSGDEHVQLDQFVVQRACRPRPQPAADDGRRRRHRARRHPGCARLGPGPVRPGARRPAPRRPGRAAAARGRGRRRSDAALGGQPLQLGVPLLDTDLHAALKPGIPALEAVHQRLSVQAGPPVAEVLEPQRLQGHPVRLALEGEGLHDPVRPHLVERAVERILLAVAGGHVAPAATGPGVPVVDLVDQRVRPAPLHEQIRVGVRPQQLSRGRSELPGDPDDRQLRVGLDLRLGHDSSSPSVLPVLSVLSSFISASTASSLE